MIINKHRLRAVSAAAVLGLALVAAACGSSSGTSTSTSTASSAAATSSVSGAATVVKMTHGAHGVYLTDGSGRALYLWMGDAGGTSHCSGACAQAWPPLATKGTPVAAGGVTGGKLTTITRSDGSRQVVYNGHPLYRFAGDTGPGSTTGQGSNGFGAKWWLVTPAGAAITTGGAASSGGAYGSSSSSGGGWG